MKRIIIVLTLLLCCKFLFAQLPMYMIEVYADGNPIMDFNKINQADIKWKMTNVTGGGFFVTETDEEDWYFNPYGMDGTSLPTFTLNLGGLHTKRPLFGGETMVFEVEVTGGIYAGYRGILTFIQSVVFINDLTGATGINLIGAPALKIEVQDTTLCASPGHIIPAIVHNAPDGYQVLWPDSRLTGLPGDKALVGTSFSADSTYQLSAILTDKNGLPLDTAFFELSFDTLPGVEIVEDDFCLAQGDALFVNGIIPANSNHQWVSTENRSRSALAESVPTQYSTVMPDHNVKIVLTATSTLTGCRNSDSVFVYLRPDKPIISIDTNTTRNNLKISWNADEKANGYTLWSNKWDAYGIENPYSQKAAFSKGITSYTINTAELDTLEFFYLTVGSNPVCPAVSDTVGYYNFDVRVNTDGKASTNMMAVYFDFGQMGVPTTKELFKRIGSPNITYIRKFVYESQGWISSKELVSSVANLFSIEQGTVLNLEATKPTKFLQYGKLPSIISFQLKGTNAIANNNIVFIQPSRIDLQKAGEIYAELLPQLLYIRNWSFETQVWTPFLLINGKPMGFDFSLRPLQPIMLDIKMGQSANWK